MFCTKCGYNAGTAKFCPKCGNPLNPQPVQETPVQNEPVAQTVQSEPVAQQQFGTQSQFNETVQPQFGTQPQSGTVPPVNADVPRYQQAPPMQPQPKKKKKKWPIVVAIIAVIVAAAAVLGFVVLPNVLSPDKHAIAAIKKLGTGLEDTASSAFDNMSLTSVSDKNQITGTLKLDTATIDGEKYSDYIKADTVTYDIEFDDFGTAKRRDQIALLVFSDNTGVVRTKSIHPYDVELGERVSVSFDVNVREERSDQEWRLNVAKNVIMTVYQVKIEEKVGA